MLRFARFRVTLRRVTTATTTAAALAIAATFGVAAPTPAAAAGTTWSFPSSDCPLAENHGLQDCIDKTAAGDTVVITQDPLASNDATIKHSLTLRAQAGLDPVLGRLSVDDTDNTVAMTVNVTGLTFALVAASFTAVDGNELALDRVTVQTPPGGDSEPIFVLATRRADFSLTRGDLLDGHDQGDGVNIDVEGSGQLRASVIATRIRSDAPNGSESGISIDTSNQATASADLMNNDIFGMGGCDCGAASGIALEADQATHLRANVVGNTIDRTRASLSASIPAIEIDNDTTPTGSLSVAVFDNILSRSATFGIEVGGSGSATSVSLGFNDYWHNGGGDVFGVTSEGQDNLHVDPKYVDATHGDLRLAAHSPVVDEGEVCSPGGVANPDASGNARLHGTSVDMGAYERGASAPTGIAAFGTGAANTLTGTAGDDILCGLGGADRLLGNGGADYLDGGKGADVVIGGPGPDRLFGGGGDDTLCSKDGVGGNDVDDGGKGDDRVRADAGDRRVSIEGTAATC